MFGLLFVRLLRANLGFVVDRDNERHLSSSLSLSLVLIYLLMIARALVN
jgi:hypothetical protein